MLSSYLNQKVVWGKTISLDEYGQAMREQKTISARKESRRRLVRDAQGKEIMSSTTVFTKEQIDVDDAIDSNVVLEVIEMVGRCGRVVGYEVLV